MDGDLPAVKNENACSPPRAPSHLPQEVMLFEKCFLARWNEIRDVTLFMMRSSTRKRVLLAWPMESD